MTHRVRIYQGTVALYRDLTRITFSDSKTECISHHVSSNNIRNNETRLSGSMNFNTFPRITLIHTILLHSIHCKDELLVFQDINFVTHTKHVCDNITPNYKSMTHRVGIQQGTVALFCDKTRITVSDIKPECISHHDSGNNIREKDTGLTGAMHYDIFPRITRLHTVLQHSIHCKDAFRILQYIKFVHTY